VVTLYFFTARDDPDAVVAAYVSRIVRVWNHLQQPLCIVRHSNEARRKGLGGEEREGRDLKRNRSVSVSCLMLWTFWK
jgi:hypothetical protein